MKPASAKNRIDWMITLVPFCLILLLAGLLFS